MQRIGKILIANRGEIARRIIRTAQKMGIRTVAIWVANDQNLQYIHEADEAVRLEGSTVADTFLNIEQILNIATSTRASAIHPGYGFLSEQATFARQCEEVGIVWIGPSVEPMKLLSDKVSATQFAASLGIPTIPTVVGEASELKARAREMRFPLLIKAAQGGGGRGMKIVFDLETIEQQLDAAAFEAQSYFGSSLLFVTPYFEQVRHVEVQIIADKHGNVLHLYDRECSIQRRYQKIIEEAPCVSVPRNVREKIWDDAVKLIQQAGYDNAGTVEFIVLPTGEYYFLEVNTRIQVEHPVTECITGIDVVECQIRSAQGEKLPYKQNEIKISGHAIECRVCAEDPEQDFLPVAGEVALFRVPQLPYLRVEADLKDGDVINPDFDSLLAKIIVHGNNRDQAIQRMQQVLALTVVMDSPTNMPMLQALINHTDFKQNHLNTQFINKHLPDLLQHIRQNLMLDSNITLILATSAFVHQEFFVVEDTSVFARWYGRWRSINYLNLRTDDGTKSIRYHYCDNKLKIFARDTLYEVTYLSRPTEKNFFEARMVNSAQTDEVHYFLVYYTIDGDGKISLHCGGKWGQAFAENRFLNTRKLQIEKPEMADKSITGADRIVAPIPGKIAKIYVEEGQEIQEGELLAIIESMKTENKIAAQNRGIVNGIFVRVGETVKANQTLFTIHNNIEYEHKTSSITE